MKTIFLFKFVLLPLVLILPVTRPLDSESTTLGVFAGTSLCAANKRKGSGCSPLPVSMHTGQIIMLTKMITASNLRFYDFKDGAPVETRRSGSSGSS